MWYLDWKRSGGALFVGCQEAAKKYLSQISLIFSDNVIEYIWYDLMPRGPLVEGPRDKNICHKQFVTQISLNFFDIIPCQGAGGGTFVTNIIFFYNMVGSPSTGSPTLEPFCFGCKNVKGQFWNNLSCFWRTLTLRKWHNIGKNASSKTHHTAGPGQSFWFLVNTGAAQILSTSRVMALSCYQANLIPKM